MDGEDNRDVGNEDIDIRNESLARIEIFTLSLILILAIFGNGLMLIALRRQLNFRPMSRMYYFMFNLSVADLFVAFGNILPQLAWDITYRFIGNDLLCRLVKYSQVFVLYLSTYVLTFMAVDRYLVVCRHTFARNHYNIRGIQGPKIFIILSWIISLVFAAPQVFIFGMTEVKVGVYDCWGHFIEPWGEKSYVIWFVASAFVLPLVIIGMSYGAICYKLATFSLPQKKSPKMNRRKNRRHSFSSPTESEFVQIPSPVKKEIGEHMTLKQQISQAKIKSVKLTLVVIICFIVCWAPFCITQIVMVFQPPKTMHDVEPLKVILLLLASMNSVFNPWIYLAFSESLYNQLRMCLGLGLGRGSCDYSIGDEQAERKPDGGKAVCRIIIEPVEIIHAENRLQDPHSSIESPDEKILQQIETKSEVI